MDGREGGAVLSLWPCCAVLAGLAVGAEAGCCWCLLSWGLGTDKCDRYGVIYALQEWTVGTVRWQLGTVRWQLGVVHTSCPAGRGLVHCGGERQQQSDIRRRTSD